MIINVPSGGPYPPSSCFFRERLLPPPIVVLGLELVKGDIPLEDKGHLIRLFGGCSLVNQPILVKSFKLFLHFRPSKPPSGSSTSVRHFEIRDLTVDIWQFMRVHSHKQRHSCAQKFTPFSGLCDRVHEGRYANSLPRQSFEMCVGKRTSVKCVRGASKTPVIRF